MNRHRFGFDMEAAWEWRPGADETPGSRAHGNRFSRPAAKNAQLPQQAKSRDKMTFEEKNRENGS